MSPALNLLSNNLQVYGPSESLPCLGVSGRAVSISPCSRSERRTLDMSVMSPKCYFRHKSFVCKARFGGQRRDSDFSRQNKNGFSPVRTRQNEERDDSDDHGDSEFLSAKNGRLSSLSNSEKDQAIAAIEPRESEIVELFMRMKPLLLERAAPKGDKRFEKGAEDIESLLALLRQSGSGGKKANRGFSNEFHVDLKNPRRSREFDGEKGKSFVEASSTVREEPQETKRPPSNRPVSNFQRRSPVPGIRYEPIAPFEESFDSVSYSDLDEKSGETHSESDLGAEAEFDFGPQETKRPSSNRPVSNFQWRSPVPRIRYKPIASFEESFNSGSYSDLDEKSGETCSESDLGAEAEFDFEYDMDLTSEEEELSETNPVNGHAAEFSPAEEENVDEREAEKQHTELKDLTAMKLGELREVARARGIKGYSRLKKSELLLLLSEGAI